MGCTHAVVGSCFSGICWYCAVQYTFTQVREVVGAAPDGTILVLWYTPARSETEGFFEVFVDSVDRLSREEPELYALCREGLEALPGEGAPFRFLPWVAMVPGEELLQGIVGDPSNPSGPRVQA